MGPGISVCFYLVIGIAVAVALWLSRSAGSGASEIFQILSAPFFWPIYLPILLARNSNQIGLATSAAAASNQQPDPDAMALAIGQVERELDAALRSLDGWAENVLTDEQPRIAELKDAWHQQAGHIRDLDQLLVESATEMPNAFTLEPESSPSDSVHAADTGSDDPYTKTLDDVQVTSRIAEQNRSRTENIDQLRQLRRLMLNDLIATIASVRDLVTKIHLAKYSGAPATRARDLVRQIAAAVESLRNQSTPRLGS